jgi:hypothetical protein
MMFRARHRQRILGVTLVVTIASALLPSWAQANNSRFYLYNSGDKLSTNTQSLELKKDANLIEFKVKVNYKLYYEDTSPTGVLEVVDGEKVIFRESCSHYAVGDDGREGEDILVAFPCSYVDLAGILTSNPILKFTYTSKIEKLTYSIPIDRKNVTSVYSSVPIASLSTAGVLSVVLEIITSAKGDKLNESKASGEACVGNSCFRIPFTDNPIERDGQFVAQGKINVKLNSNQVKKLSERNQIILKSSYSGFPILDFSGNSSVPRSVDIEEPAAPITKLISSIKVPTTSTLGTRFNASVKISGKGTANCSVYLAPSRARGIYSGNGVHSPTYRIQSGTTRSIPLVMGEKFQGTWGAILNCTDAGNNAYLKINVATLIQR